MLSPTAPRSPPKASLAADDGFDHKHVDTIEPGSTDEQDEDEISARVQADVYMQHLSLMTGALPPLVLVRAGATARNLFSRDI